MHAKGGYVAVWMSNGQDGSGNGIYAARVRDTGGLDSSEFRVNSFTTGDQLFPAVSVGPTGDHVVVWQSSGQDGSGYGIFAQRYNAAGVPQGSEFRVNSTTLGNQVFPAVTTNAAGDFVIVWQSELQDGDGYGIYAQSY